MLPQPHRNFRSAYSKNTDRLILPRNGQSSELFKTVIKSLRRSPSCLAASVSSSQFLVLIAITDRDCRATVQDGGYPGMINARVSCEYMFSSFSVVTEERTTALCIAPAQSRVQVPRVTTTGCPVREDGAVAVPFVNAVFRHGQRCMCRPVCTYGPFCHTPRENLTESK